MGALEKLVVRVLPWVPRPLVEKVSARYIAGAQLPDALRTIRELQQRGLRTTVDVLGEFVHTLEQAEAAVGEYDKLIAALAHEGLDSQVSVKLTQLGLKVDVDACRQHLRRLLTPLEALDSLLTIDMEDSSCTEDTLRLYESLRRESEHVGTVLQARLRRSRADLERLLPLQPNLRICKGIYLEPERIAFTRPEEIRRSFVELVETMLQHPSFVGIATHDDELVEACERRIAAYGLGAERYEFQMLLGVREDLRSRLVRAGHPVRVYVPYGSEWYAYSLRRLQENPAIAGHILRGFLPGRR